jgi:hypothetical protein
VNLTILNGNITAGRSGETAGIGSGAGDSGGESTVESLTIQGGKITANGASAGIGRGGEGGEVKLLTFSGNVVLRCDAAEGQSAVTASSILLADASLIFHTPGNRLFGEIPSRVGDLNLTILNGAVISEGADGERLSGLNGTFLGIGNATFPIAGAWTFCKDPPPGRFFRFTPFWNIVMKTVIPFGCRGISKIGLFHFEIFIG